jgi:hypothetical protein
VGVEDEEGEVAAVDLLMYSLQMVLFLASPLQLMSTGTEYESPLLKTLHYCFSLS